MLFIAACLLMAPLHTDCCSQEVPTVYIYLFGTGSGQPCSQQEPQSWQHTRLLWWRGPSLWSLQPMSRLLR